MLHQRQNNPDRPRRYSSPPSAPPACLDDLDRQDSIPAQEATVITVPPARPTPYSLMITTGFIFTYRFKYAVANDRRNQHATEVTNFGNDIAGQYSCIFGEDELQHLLTCAGVHQHNPPLATVTVVQNCGTIRPLSIIFYYIVQKAFKILMRQLLSDDGEPKQNLMFVLTSYFILYKSLHAHIRITD